MDYWTRLQTLEMYSQQRRERYIIIYVWKVLEQRVSNPSNCAGIEPHYADRTGRQCVRWTLPSQASKKVQTLLATSFAINGAKLFNCLPRSLRNLSGCTVNSFKTKLDSFLQDIPDEPPVPGYTHLCRALKYYPGPAKPQAEGHRNGKQRWSTMAVRTRPLLHQVIK